MSYINAAKFIKKSNFRGLLGDVKEAHGTMYIRPNIQSNVAVFNLPGRGITLLREGDEIGVTINRGRDSGGSYTRLRRMTGGVLVNVNSNIAPDIIP